MTRCAPGITIGWFGVNAFGQVLVSVSSMGTLADAQSRWQSFLARYGDAGTRYVVSWYASGG